LNSGEYSIIEMAEMNQQTEIHSSFLADIDRDEIDEIIFLTHSPDTLLYVLEEDLALKENFPVELELDSFSLPNFADLEGNGFLEILIGGENDFNTVDKTGNLGKPSEMIESPDSLNSASGIVAIDLENDGQFEVTGNMSRNRLSVWDNLQNNDFEIRRNYPLAFASRSRNLPVISPSDSTIYISSDNGMIFRQKLTQSPRLSSWYCEYGNLQRTASWLGDLPENVFLQQGIFVEDETYIYPNPLSSVFNSTIFDGHEWSQAVTIRVMTSKNSTADIKVFDIAGNIIYKKRLYCEAYVSKGVQIDAKKLASGMYFAVIKADGKAIERKFAIEK
jgi:hypothetical protein